MRGQKGAERPFNRLLEGRIGNRLVRRRGGAVLAADGENVADAAPPGIVRGDRPGNGTVRIADDDDAINVSRIAGRLAQPDAGREEREDEQKKKARRSIPHHGGLPEACVQAGKKR